MSLLDNKHFYDAIWLFYVGVFIFFFTFIPFDILAVKHGHRDGVGDNFTFTHWIVVHVGLSLLGALLGLLVGYMVAHFFIVHKNG